MPGESIFADEWRDCLKAHYEYVVREQDVRTERTLRGVMHNVGFSDAELNELRVRATMHVDDVGEDFVPDLEIFEAVVAPVPAEPIEVVPIAQPEPEVVAEASPEPELPDDADSATPDEEVPPPYNESGPQQISLF